MTPDTTMTVVLVEDDADIREIAQLALAQGGGLEVEVCKRGRAALEVIPEVQPDLVLLDVMMPGIDGIEVLERLRENSETAEIPVIFLTAKAQPAEIDRYRQMGVVDVIVKPFEAMELAGRVRESIVDD